MKTKLSRPLVTLVALAGFGTALYAVADDDHHWRDFGKTVEKALHGKSEQLFGTSGRYATPHQKLPGLTVPQPKRRMIKSYSRRV